MLSMWINNVEVQVSYKTVHECYMILTSLFGKSHTVFHQIVYTIIINLEH